MKSQNVKESNDVNFSKEERPEDVDSEGAVEVEDHIRDLIEIRNQEDEEALKLAKMEKLKALEGYDAELAYFKQL